MRLNVLLRPGPAQPPPQIIGRLSDVERLLDEAGQRAQEVERGAEAIEETAAVAAEERGRGRSGYLGGLAEGAAALAPTAGEVAVHDLLKGREYNRNKAMEGFDEVNDPRIARAVHQGGYADVLLRPTMVGILRCGKMLPPQLNLVIQIEFADATTALWSENAGAHPAGATLSTDFEIQVVLDSALVESFNRVLLSGRSLVFSYPTVHTQQSSVPNGVAEHNVTVARAFTKLMGAFVIRQWRTRALSEHRRTRRGAAGRGLHDRPEHRAGR